MWGTWETCTRSCGGGRQLRRRQCITPMKLKGKGLKCEGGFAGEIRNCNPQSCKGLYLFIFSLFFRFFFIDLFLEYEGVFKYGIKSVRQ